MKKILFSTLILWAFALNGITQNPYYPLVQEGNNRQQWNVTYITTGVNYPNDYFTEIQTINDDITLDGVDYKLVWSKMRYDSPQIAGAVREENKRVYFRNYYSAGYYEEEALLYDFNLTVGDMVTAGEYGVTLMVIEESEVEVDGTIRRQLGLGDPTNGMSPYSEVSEYWIEGVGSTKGFLNSGYESSWGAFVYLLCYHEDDNLLWQNENYESCVMNSGVFTFFDETSGLNFNITGENTVEVTRKLDIMGELNTYEGDIIIPETVTYGECVYTVTGIGERAFSTSLMLNSVVVPQTVTYVGENAFYYCPSMQSVSLSDNITDMGNEVFHYCEHLTTVNIPQSMSFLPDYLFSECVSLSSIDIPEQVTHIGDYAFSGTALSSIVIPNTVNTVGTGAFNLCRSLESARLPESLECINGYLFYGCENLRNVNIPNSVKSIKNGAFYNCKLEGDLVFPEGLVEVGISAFEQNKLTAVSFQNPKTSIKRMAFAGCIELTSVSLPNQLDTIARYAFQLTGLQSISIPSTVVAINEGAFWGCDSLSQIYIPKNVRNIDVGAFGYCHGLKNIGVDKDNVYYKSVDGVLFNASKSILVQYPAGKKNNNYQVPDSVTNVFAMSFEGAENLQYINLPNALANIGRYAFFRCYGLQTVTIPSGSIGGSAFYECNGLTSAVIGPDVVNIGSNVFQYCSNLTLVILGNPQATILSGAFNTDNSNDKLTMVCLGDTPGYGINEQIFPNQTLQEMMIVPCGTQQVYEDWWGSYWYSHNFEEDCNEHQIHLIGNIGSNQVTLSSETAMLGEKVHYTVALGSGFMLNSVEVCKADDELVKIPVKDNGFVMPNFDVVVKAHFQPHSLEEPVAEAGFQVYPNPTDGFITLMSANGTQYHITNIMGQVLMSGTITSETEQINVSSLSEGMFFIIVDSSTTKLIKR